MRNHSSRKQNHEKQTETQNERKVMNNSKNNESKKARGMSRKQFLKTAGLGSITAASVLALLGALATSVSAQDPTPVTIRFVCNSRTATVGGVRYLAQMSGEGLITGAQVVATG